MRDVLPAGYDMETCVAIAAVAVGEQPPAGHRTTDAEIACAKRDPGYTKPSRPMPARGSLAWRLRGDAWLRLMEMP